MEFVEKTKVYMEYAKVQLEGTTEFRHVEKYYGTSYGDLFKLIHSNKKMPMAFVVYTGSGYGNRPRRSAGISIMVVSRSLLDRDRAFATIQDLVDLVTDTLHRKGEGHYKFMAQGDTPYDFGLPGVAAYEIKFDVEDH